MLSLPNMILIAGNARNSGKTSLACSLIKHLSVNARVIGLKVTNITPDDSLLHGNHAGIDFGNNCIFNETGANPDKDTARMLSAGAEKSYFALVENNIPSQKLLHFLENDINNKPVICESRSLRQWVKPGIFIMMNKVPAPPEAKNVDHLLEIADKVFDFASDRMQINEFIDQLLYQNGKYFQNII